MKDQLYIKGQWVEAKAKTTIPVINPVTEQIICEVAEATEPDIDDAIQAARTAFQSWRNTTGAERAKYLRAIAAGVSDRLEELTRLEILNTGKTVKEARMDMEDTVACFEFYAEQAIQLDSRQNTVIPLALSDFQAKVRYEPVGVAGQIIPWNYPLLMMAWKTAPALAAGCTCVLKPSEITPLTALAFAEIIHDIGLPPGVLNIVPGYGATAGAAISLHPGVDKLAFTGSIPTGAAVMQAAAVGIKNISLELGGKSPFVIFDDADLEQAVEWIMFGIFWNKGENCCATSRLIVQDAIAPTLLERLKVEVEKISIGDPLDAKTLLGPIVHKAHYQKVMSYIEAGKAEGLKLLTGGNRPRHIETGFFVEPTIFVEVPPTSKLWCEEIFGPVLCVCTFTDEAEALHLANDTPYGLGAAVMSRDEARAHRVANALEAGVVWVNCSQPVFAATPFGGVKQSGIGRELGVWGLENYLEVKQITSYVSSKPWGWYLHRS
jgi:betaine-aldehyde dehydrogenase